MTRWRIDIAYDGTTFHGWATQPGLRTVQGELEGAIADLLCEMGLPWNRQLTVAGRTDAGVHARGQVAHMDATIDAGLVRSFEARLAKRLPNDLLVRQVSCAPAGFDARFSATGRTYCYRLWDANSLPFPPMGHFVETVRLSLDVAAMAAGASSLLGLRDFAPFCRPREGTDSTTIRQLRRFDVFRADDPSGTIECWLEADAFCHSMVRSLVGAVVAVGAGQRNIAWLAQMAAASTRAGDVAVRPPGGLTLEAVSYPPDGQLISRAIQARQIRVLDPADHPLSGALGDVAAIEHRRVP